MRGDALKRTPMTGTAVPDAFEMHPDGRPDARPH
jgi:hypothetical protein